MGFSIEWQGEMQIAEFFGDMTIEVLQAALKAVYDDPRSDEMTKNIVDLSQVERFLIDENEVIVPVAYAVGNQIDKAHILRRAFVVTTEETRRFAEQYKVKLSGNKSICVEIFDNRQAANLWLDHEDLWAS